MLAQRVLEVEATIDVLKSKGIGKKLFNTGSVKIATNKLTVSGHSFGGITAIEVAKKKKVAAAIALDPWFWPYHEGILQPTAKNLYCLDRTSPPV
jgi:hypothetical protein